MSILIVDDEPDVALLVRQKFRRQIASGEMSVTFALNGEEALERLAADADLDIIVTDINMPVMDGLTLLTRLADYPRPVKAVIVSAYDDMPNIRTAMNRGAYDFLTKPLDFADLETTLAKTRRELDDLQAGLRAREHLSVLNAELDVAMKIQQAILPETITGDNAFSISASMSPARQVGGDFYDFFLIDANQLGICIGDVSGKGIPAALFMAVSRTLLRATAIHGDAPSKCLAHVNQVLLHQSKGELFVTLFYAILNLQTGELRYSAGGQTPPCIVSQSGGIRFLREPRGFMLGMLEDATFAEGQTQLAPGDALVLYTDGVTEAENEAGEFFTEGRLREVLQTLSGCSPETVVISLLASVDRFTGGFLLSDDITVLAVRYCDVAPLTG